MGVQKGPIALESRALLLWLLAVGLRVWWLSVRIAEESMRNSGVDPNACSDNLIGLLQMECTVSYCYSRSKIHLVLFLSIRSLKH